jgi:hypothetical protein
MARSALTAGSIDHSSRGEMQPAFSAMSPRVNRNTSHVTNTPTSALDRLLQDYEQDFGNIFNSAESLLATCGVELTSQSRQSSLIGARQSSIDFDPSHSQVELNSRSHSLSLRAGPSGDTAVAADEVTMILERYSDRLAAMVAEKMLASQSTSTGTK